MHVRDQASFSKRVSWRIEAAAFDFVRLIMKLFTFNAISNFGGWLLRTIGPRTSKHHIAKTGMKIAFPDASDQQLNSWLRESWDNTGRTLAEFPIMNRIQVFGDKSRVTVKGLEHLDNLKENKQAAVLVSGHFANWEIMAAVFAQYGVDVQVTYRQINNPHIDKRVREQREKYGIKLMIPKSGPRGAMDLIKALRSGESVALLNDQKFNEGIAIPFFGVDAMTAPGPTRLALKTKVPMIAMSTVRKGSHFTVTVHPPFELQNTGDSDADARAGTLMVTEFVEDRIREMPGQWFWVHRRWPKDVYK